MAKGKTAVLIHGCHLQADLDGQTWEEIVWGIKERKPTLSGRATMGLDIALRVGARRVVFSTGASQRENIKEGQYTYGYAQKNSVHLAEVLGVKPTSLEGYLLQYHVLDLVSQNTTEECRLNFRRAAKDGFTDIILVSSPWHIQRCHTEALKVAEEMRAAGEFVPRISAQASHGSTEGIVILEPPHRGDRPKTRWHEIGRRLFRVPENRRERVELALEMLLSKNDA